LESAVKVGVLIVRPW